MKSLTLVSFVLTFVSSMNGVSAQNAVLWSDHSIHYGIMSPMFDGFQANVPSYVENALNMYGCTSADIVTVSGSSIPRLTSKGVGCVQIAAMMTYMSPSITNKYAAFPLDIALHDIGLINCGFQLLRTMGWKTMAPKQTNGWVMNVYTPAVNSETYTNSATGYNITGKCVALANEVKRLPDASIEMFDWCGSYSGLESVGKIFNSRVMDTTLIAKYKEWVISRTSDTAESALSKFVLTQYCTSSGCRS